MPLASVFDINLTISYRPPPLSLLNTSKLGVPRPVTANCQQYSLKQVLCHHTWIPTPCGLSDISIIIPIVSTVAHIETIRPTPWIISNCYVRQARLTSGIEEWIEESKRGQAARKACIVQ